MWLERCEIWEISDWKDMRLEIWFEMWHLRDMRLERYVIGEMWDLRNIRLERYAIGDLIWDVWFERYEIGKIYNWRDVQCDWKNYLREVWLERWLVIWFDMCDLRDKWFEKCAMWLEKVIWEKCDWRDDWRLDLRCAICKMCDWRGDRQFDLRCKIGKICNWRDMQCDWKSDLREVRLERRLTT